MEINQASGDQSVRDDIDYDITMGNDVAQYISWHHNIAMNLLLCITMHIYVILLWVVRNKKRDKFVFDQSQLVFEQGYFTEVSRYNLCAFPRLIKH